MKVEIRRKMLQLLRQRKKWIALSMLSVLKYFFFCFLTPSFRVYGNLEIDSDCVLQNYILSLSVLEAIAHFHHLIFSFSSQRDCPLKRHNHVP